MASRPLLFAGLGLVLASVVSPPVAEAQIASPPPAGPVVPKPAPIGGLRTRPLDAPTVPGAEHRRTTRPGVGRPRDDRRLRRLPPGYGYWPGYGYGLGIADAPVPRGGAVYGPSAAPTPPVRTWFPTGDRPRWRVDSSLTPVQAWRDLIVTDAVCDGYGTCMEREQRVRAPWVPVCRCYLFTDALGRRWEVADR